MHQSQPGWGSGTDPAPPTPFCSTQVGKILEAAGTWWRCSTISSRCKAPGTSCPRGTSLCSSLLVLEIAQCRSRVNWCIDSLRQVDWINWVKATTTATLRNSLAYCKGYQLSFTLSLSLPSLCVWNPLQSKLNLTAPPLHWLRQSALHATLRFKIYV